VKHKSWHFLLFWLGCALAFNSFAFGTNRVVLPKASRQGGAMSLLNCDKISMDLGGTSPDDLEKPLALALGQLLEASDELETPLNNARDVALSQVDKGAKLDPRVQLERAREVLKNHFNRPTTQLVLLKSGEEDRGFQPERGEDIKENWVFSLLIPTLSDHIYWIVVSKDQSPKAYVYGFN